MKMYIEPVQNTAHYVVMSSDIIAQLLTTIRVNNEQHKCTTQNQTIHKQTLKDKDVGFFRKHCITKPAVLT